MLGQFQNDSRKRQYFTKLLKLIVVSVVNCVVCICSDVKIYLT